MSEWLGQADFQEPESIKKSRTQAGRVGQEVELPAGALPPLDPPDEDDAPDEEDPDEDDPDDPPDEDDPDDDPPDDDPPEDELDEPESPPEVDEDDSVLLAVPAVEPSEPAARESVR
ncbi:hypothetical protein [Micromonospora profundi]|uniref:hypothetical protein n=1 Tax=Micromonospora TaxID=1873 RepID=UPI00339DAAC4